MKADISALRDTPRGLGHYRRETGFCREIVAIDPASGRAVVTVRLYAPGVVVYCCVWIIADAAYGSGGGKAGGGNYHRPSAALASALADAGVKLSERIDGVGDGAMNRAIEAVAKAVTGKRRILIHVAHA